MNKLAGAALVAILSVASVGDADAVSGVVTGQFKATISITIKSSIPTSTPIQCTLSASVYGYGTGNNPVTDLFDQNATVPATRSGSSATCQLIIPYRWKLVNSNDTVTLSYSISATNANGVGRYSDASLASIPVPPSGSVTIYQPLAVI